MKIKSILSALLLMVCTMASAQKYLNVKLENGTYRSFKATPNMEISFGEKAGAEIMEPMQVIKLYKGDQLVAEYWDYEVDRVVYEEQPTTTGTVNATINGVVTPVKWVQLWKNGPKFAEYNVGATSATEYGGGYYAWGGSQDKTDDHNTTNTGSGDLTSTDDTATKLWGGNWRMPTKAEFEALSKNCTCTFTTQSGVGGLLLQGKEGTAFESNRVFLPAAGRCSYGSVSGQGTFGYYWSSAPDGSSYAYYLDFSSVKQYVGSSRRDFGYSVRAVVAE